MLYRNIVYVVCLALACLALFGCAGQKAELESAGTQPGTGGPLSLPSPQALLPKLHGGRKTSLVKFAEADVQQDGALNSIQLPSNNVASNGTALKYVAHFTPGTGTLDDLAYAGYHFNLPFYDRNPQVRLSWKVAPASFTQYFFYLANWKKNRWDWYPGNANNRLDLLSLDDCISQFDDIAVVIMVIGEETAQLDSIRIGGLPPVAALTVADPIGPVPYVPTLDASASTDPENLKLTYQFDFDGDGIFDSIPGSEATLDYNYSSNGDYQPAVKVTNSSNVSAIASIDVHAIGEWSRSFGSSGQDAFKDVTYLQDGSIYAVADYGTPQANLVLTKWTPAGELVWAKQWDSGEDDYAISISSDFEGNLIVGGQTSRNGVRQALVQKYTPDGVKVWSKRFGDISKSTMLLSLKVDSDAIYCGGMATLSSGDELFAAKLDYDGDLLWSVYRDTGSVDVFDDMVLSYDIFGGPAYGVALLGEAQLGGNSNLYKVRIDEDGKFLSSVQLGTSAEPKSNGKFLYTNDFIAGGHYYIAGQTKIGATEQFFVLATDSNGDNVWGKRYPSLDIRPYFLNGDGSGSLLVGGGNGTVASLYHLTTGGVDLKHYTLSSPAGSLATYRAQPYESGMLLVGLSHNSTSIPGEAQLPTPSSFYYGFTALNSSGGSAGYSTEDTALDALTDVTQSGVLNTGGGVADGLLTWRTGF